MSILGAVAFIVIPVAAAVGIALWKASKNIKAEIKNQAVQMPLLPRDDHASHKEHLVGVK